jgi:cyclic dehypoxanthinyl futalosine synthase
VTRETGDILQRAADGGRISAEEACCSTPRRRCTPSARRPTRSPPARYPDGIVTYLIDRNINYTNVCVTACRFCAFYRAPKHEQGWSHPIEEILRRCGEAVDLGATQVMLQGGTTPTTASSTTRAVLGGQGGLPELVIHSIGPSEILHMAKVSGCPLRRPSADQGGRPRLDRRGRGGDAAARPAPRDRAAEGVGERWLEVMEVAHGLGVESTATMMMGTGETNAERIEHLRMIRDVQDRTGGFRSVHPVDVPAGEQPPQGADPGHVAGVPAADRGRPPVLPQRGAPAVVLADDRQGRRPTVPAHGRRRPGSIMLEENVISSAGARHRSNLHDLIWLIRSGGRIPAQRDTLYRHLRVHHTPADDPTDDRVRSHVSSIAMPVRTLPLVATS